MKRLLALLLVSLLVLPLFACASTPKTDAPAADTSTTNTPADDAPADDTPADDTAEADQPADGEPAADDNGLVWPRLANDDVTLTLMTLLPNEISSLVTRVDHPDNIPWNEAPRRTGVNLDITTLSAMSFAEQMKLALAAEDFMDIMNGGYARTHFPCKLWDAGKNGLTLSLFEWQEESKTLLYGQRDYPYGEPLTKPEIPEGNPIRLYTLEELRALLGVRGMTVVDSFSDVAGSPSGDSGIQLLVYSRKN